MTKDDQTGKVTYAPLPSGKYDVIYADPPWDYRGREQFGFAGDVGVSSGGAIQQYETLTPVQLAALDVASAAAADCVLFMWTTGPMMNDAMTVLQAWGFTYKTVAFVWHKQRVNPGYYTLSSCEYCLVATQGRIPTPRGSRNERQFVSLPRGKHSAKPLEVRSRINRMFPTQSKLELFARNVPAEQRWSTWGNEVAEHRRPLPPLDATFVVT